MNKERFFQYVKDFNKREYREFISTYFTKDAVFETPDVRCEGQESIIDFFIRGHKGVDETLKVKNILMDGHCLAAELEAEMKVTADRPDHHIRPSKRGETFIMTQCAFYDIKNGKFCHVRVYRRKVSVL